MNVIKNSVSGVEFNGIVWCSRMVYLNNSRQ